jgi:putative heme iron utilization protein
MNVLSPVLSHAKPTRELVSRHSRGVLATLSDQHFPYASMVDYAPLPDGDVLFLLSALAEHTRFLKVNPKTSLLVAPDLNAVDAFAKPRVTLLGEVEPVGRDREYQQAFLSRHPKAQGYMMMGDFGFFRMLVESARYIGGFGRMSWIEQDEYRNP